MRELQQHEHDERMAKKKAKQDAEEVQVAKLRATKRAECLAAENKKKADKAAADATTAALRAQKLAECEQVKFREFTQKLGQAVDADAARLRVRGTSDTSAARVVWSVSRVHLLGQVTVLFCFGEGRREASRIRGWRRSDVK